jgi:hypothetical protein
LILTAVDDKAIANPTTSNPVPLNPKAQPTAIPTKVVSNICIPPPPRTTFRRCTSSRSENSIPKVNINKTTPNSAKIEIASAEESPSHIVAPMFARITPQAKYPTKSDCFALTKSSETITTLPNTMPSNATTGATS